MALRNSQRAHTIIQSFENRKFGNNVPEQSKLRVINVPIFEGYFSRPQNEDAFRRTLVSYYQRSGKEGFLFVDGATGIGKTTLLCHLLHDPSHKNFIKQHCKVDIVIWLDCMLWNCGFERDLERKEQFLRHLTRIDGNKYSKSYPSLKVMLEHHKSREERVMFFLDNVQHENIVSTMVSECPKLLCIIISRNSQSLIGSNKTYVASLTDPISQQPLKNPFLLSHVEPTQTLRIFYEHFKIDADIKELQRLVSISQQKASVIKLLGHHPEKCSEAELGLSHLVMSMVPADSRSKIHLQSFLLFKPGQWLGAQDLLALLGQIFDPTILDGCCLISKNEDNLWSLPTCFYDPLLTITMQELGYHRSTDLRLRLLIDIQKLNMKSHQNDLEAFAKICERLTACDISLYFANINDDSFLWLMGLSTYELDKTGAVHLLQAAARCGYTTLAELARLNGADVAESLLQEAAIENHLNIVQWLFAHELKPNQETIQFCLYNASKHSNYAVCQYLLLKGSKTDLQSLEAACQWHHRRVVRLLLENSEIEVDENLIQQAIRSRDEELAQILIAYIENFGKRNDFGETTLMMALDNGFLELAEQVIELTENINVVNCWGETALSIAMNLGARSLVRMLESYGADREMGVKNVSDLMLACKRAQHWKIITAVVDSSELNAKDSQGKTALAWAILSNDGATLKQLLKLYEEESFQHILDTHLQLAEECLSSENFICFISKHKTAQVPFISKIINNKENFDDADYEIARNFRDEFGWSALNWALFAGNIAALQWLIADVGINIQQEPADRRGQTPMTHVKIRNKHLSTDIIELLHEKGK